MGYAVFTLGLLGFAVGSAFRLRGLLAILGLLLLGSILFAALNGFGWLDTALTIMIVQTIVQGAYFLGLVARALLTGTHGARRVF